MCSEASFDGQPDDVTILRAVFRTAVRLACAEWGYLPADEAYFDAFWARIPDEYQARIGDGIRGGAVVVQGYRFRPVGLAL